MDGVGGEDAGAGSGGKDGASLGVSPPSPPWCPRAAWLRTGMSLLTQQQQSWLRAGGAAPQKRGRRCPLPGHRRDCPQPRSPVPPGEPQRGRWHGQGGQGTPGTLRGHPKAPQRHGGARLRSQGKDRGDPGGHIRAARVRWQSVSPVLGEGRGACGSMSGGWRRMGHPGGAPRAHHRRREKDRDPWGASSGQGVGHGTLGVHPDPIIATGRRMGHPGGAPPGLGEGWGTPTVHLWSWAQDRAPRGCISVARRRMWHPGDALRAHHCDWERDRASWGYVPGDGKRMGHPGGAPTAHHHHWEKDGASWGWTQSPPGEGWSTPRVHLRGQEKDRAPQGCIPAAGRRMWHLRDAPRAHHCHWEKDVAPWGCIPGVGKRTEHPREAPRAHY